VDWWTLGILIYEMIYATTPFKGGTRDDTFANIMKIPVHFKDSHKTSPACKDVIVRLLDKNELTRLGSKSGASEVKQHKWFSKINWGLLRNTQPPIVPASTNGVDEVNFRQMESGSMHHDPHPSKKATGGVDKNMTLKAVAGKPGGRNKSNITGDDEMETAPNTPSSVIPDKEDLFGAFANVTLHYDGETY